MEPLAPDKVATRLCVPLDGAFIYHISICAPPVPWTFGVFRLVILVKDEPLYARVLTELPRDILATTTMRRFDCEPVVKLSV